MPDAATRLRAFIDRNGLSQGAAARWLGVSSPALCEWLSGAKRPAADMRDRIARWTRSRVPAAAWLTAAEADAVASVKPFRRSG